MRWRPTNSNNLPRLGSGIPADVVELHIFNIGFFKNGEILLAFEDIIISSLPNGPKAKKKEGLPNDGIIKVQMFDCPPSTLLFVSKEHRWLDIIKVSYLG